MTASETQFGLSAIGQIALILKNLDRAVEFYRDVLGMNYLFSAPGMAFFQCGDVRLMLGTPERPELDHAASIIYYKVGDINSAFETLSARDVEFEHEPRLVHKAEDHDLWLAFFRDQEHNLLALMSEVPRVTE